ncbi:hypothetical protein ACQR1W_33030 [Bradyrhizobium sp. HKCCYLS1011]|uniref:hypothetical protein n=1 Tax=Bradyrhizobium sp. HKCCYLS1011 TaxID=3420733 RepID=UPI003EB7FBEF
MSTSLGRYAHALPFAAGGLLATAAVAVVAYLLWPTWGAAPSKGPDQLPVSVGGTLFNVPTAAVRMKIQRHSGPQERIDLGYEFPSLTAPEAPRHVSVEQLNEGPQPIDRIFVSIAAHHDALSPDARLRTIYPRYLDAGATSVRDGLTMRGFRAGTPYDGEDLFLAEQPPLAARCTRDAATPGMCLSERRIDGADLIFRFPRSWLSHWQNVADAMDRLTSQLHHSRG